MLVYSDRIKYYDLELWKQYEEADYIHTIPDWKIVKSKNIISEFAKERCWNSFSTGKDSIVTSFLVAELNLDVPIVFIKTFRTHLYCDEIIKIFEKIINKKIIIIEEKENDNWKHWGYGIKIANKMFGSRSIRGIRAEESGQRLLSAKVHGVVTENSCRPILHWTAQDVFAFLAQNNLPVHPNYAMLGGGRWERDRIRVGSIGGERGCEMGRNEWEKEYYGDILRRL